MCCTGKRLMLRSLSRSPSQHQVPEGSGSPSFAWPCVGLWAWGLVLIARVAGFSQGHPGNAATCWTLATYCLDPIIDYVSPGETAGFPTSPGQCYTMATMANTWVHKWLSPERFERYLKSCDGDSAQALALYEWNALLSQAYMRDISHFEVALRNAYDQAFRDHWKGTDHWILDPKSPAVVPIWNISYVKRLKMRRGSDANYHNRKSVNDAIEKYAPHRTSPGKIIAELTFGFWSSLTKSTHEKSIWVPYLHHAFPIGTNRKSTHRDIDAINKIRNRIAHNEPICFQSELSGSYQYNPYGFYQTIFKLFTAIAPEAAAYTMERSAVLDVLTAKPR